MRFTEYVRQLPDSGMGRRTSLWVRIHIDPFLLLALLGVCIGGLFVLYSASSGDWGAVQRQMVRFGVGFLAMIVVAQLDPRLFQQWGGAVFALGVALLVAVLVTGTDAKGAQRWLTIPGVVRFQPSEIMKLAVPVMLAWYLSRYGVPPRHRHLAVSLFLLLIPVALIVRQPDLGTSLLIAASGIFVIFLAGLSWKLIVSFAMLAVSMLPLMWIFVMHDYQKQRVLTLFDPSSDPLGAGWNIIQSMTAIGSGGLQGKGFMQGTQSQLDFLPESHTDFIIAVLGEEFGFVGAAVLLAAYALIVLRGMLIAVRGRDNFCRLLAGSLTLTFFIYVFVNVGMVSGILPVVGVPLPLVSYGGTSIVTLLTSFGILMSISTHPRT
ncbi:rod shape-determining protein RodA [Saccharospirillum salsuginis]|uniref:Peptidoglycan glycosyltransferase MrdB n=1 Tax=Saccharospirillum salsuginis TaxID=418750 RepID=A0A918KN72_9GAMM|nr:rod shape-determining protein RodA [Saccharospirillum salsuginis]GGX69579.1 rod shape-determining protein RodA [Saccharospirillum salsuginis]